MFALSPSPERPRLQREGGIRRRAYLFDKQYRVAAETHLGAIGEEDPQAALGIRAQDVAGQKVLLHVDALPAGDIDEADFLTELARDDGTGRRRISGNDVGERLRASEAADCDNDRQKGTHASDAMMLRRKLLSRESVCCQENNCEVAGLPANVPRRISWN